MSENANKYKEYKNKKRFLIFLIDTSVSVYIHVTHFIVLLEASKPV